ncbi:MAG TPA: PHB depolymerase family esterase [Anaerolineales bacterium]|nr:PHB depolymerase family esterase [Anaerolineales bacterium]
MRRFACALLALSLNLLECTRTFNATPTASADTTHTLTFGGLRRTYLVHIPSSYTGSQAVPLVFDFHGGLGNAASQMHTSNFEALADEKDFIVVYPNGTGWLGDKLLTWNGGTCCGYAAKNDIDDVGFVRASISDLESTYKIDPRRIYATGLSNGAILSQRLACEASDIFAAIAPVSGTLNYPGCQPEEGVSIIEFHGTADQHLPYDGGIGDRSLADVSFASVKDTIDRWLKFDQCPTASQTTTFADIQHDTYSNCAKGTAVELYTIIGGGHAWPGGTGPAWPGGDQPTHTISATDLIWDFFAAHPKP